MRARGGLARALIWWMLAAGGTAPAVAGHDRIDPAQVEGALQPLNGIIQKAKVRQAGRVIEAELKEVRGRYVYEVEILDTNGRVWEFYYDARTGDFIREGLEEGE